MKPTNWRRREEQRKEAEAIGRFHDEVLGPLLGFVPEDPFKTAPKPKLPCQIPNCRDPECGRTFSHGEERDDAEVARCACGAVFYSTDAAHDHECEDHESTEVDGI